MRNLYIDFDGVIVNTIEVSYAMAEKQGLEKTYENYLQFFQSLNWEEVFKKTEPINDAFGAIKRIKKSGKYNVAILTHVTSLHEIEAKVKYIRKYLKNITIISVPKSISKTEMLDAKDAILIDDYVANLDQWTKAGGKAIKFDLDKNGKGYPVIDRLDMIIEKNVFDTTY